MTASVRDGALLDRKCTAARARAHTCIIFTCSRVLFPFRPPMPSGGFSTAGRRPNCRLLFCEEKNCRAASSCSRGSSLATSWSWIFTQTLALVLSPARTTRLVPVGGFAAFPRSVTTIFPQRLTGSGRCPVISLHPTRLFSRQHFGQFLVQKCFSQMNRCCRQ